VGHVAEGEVVQQSPPVELQVSLCASANMWSCQSSASGSSSVMSVSRVISGGSMAIQRRLSVDSHHVCDASKAARPLNGVGPSPKQGTCQTIASGVLPGGRFPLDHSDLLRRLSLHDERVVAEVLGGAGSKSREHDPTLDPRTLALVRLAALVAVGGAVPSYGALADAAVDAGATAAEIVDVLAGVIPVVGLPCVVAAAPKLALAFGHDVDDTFAILPGG
jgi:4-carboxymuconolactone decarboxylase